MQLLYGAKYIINYKKRLMKNENHTTASVIKTEGNVYRH
jgi:hypothetical protein